MNPLKLKDPSTKRFEEYIAQSLVWGAILLQMPAQAHLCSFIQLCQSSPLVHTTTMLSRLYSFRERAHHLA